MVDGVIVEKPVGLPESMVANLRISAGAAEEIIRGSDVLHGQA